MNLSQRLKTNKLHRAKGGPVAMADGGTPDALPDAPWVAAPSNNLPDAPWAEPSTATKPMSGIGAGLAGLESGATFGFSDKIRGALAQYGAASVPYEVLAQEAEEKGIDPNKHASDYYASVPSQAYKEASTAEKTRQEQAAQEHPYIYGGANVAGSVAPMMLAAPAAAPTWLGRAAQASKMGAAYGALTGAGHGEDLSNAATGALTGAATGAVTGAVAAPLVEGAGALIGAVGSKAANVVRGITNPEGEAARRIIVAAQRDLKTQGAPLGPQELQAANDADIPRALVDAGGETTRALARSSANTSPEARSALSSFIIDRFKTQQPRAAAFVDDLVGGAGDAGLMQESLKDAARQANKPAYASAYRAGSSGLWSPELERLTGSPAVVEAMKDAAQNGKTRAIADGFGGFNPGVKVTPDGQVIFNKGSTGVPTYPDLQFWDYTYRALRDAGQSAMRAGRSSEGGAIGSVAGSLRNELDNMVPQYQQAREGAARFFGASDALEAGQQFATSKMNNQEAARAVNAMSAPERQLFMKGYASQLVNKINESGDSRNVANVFGNSPADRQRAVIALGPQKANQLEAYVRAERILDTARGTVQGNSTTARQLAELGLAGGAYGVGSQGDFTHPTWSGALSAALAFGAMRGGGAINQRLAQRVGEMLASDDPAVLKEGFKVLTRNSGFLNALRSFDTASATTLGTRQGANMFPAIQGSVPAIANQNQQQ